MRQDGDRTSTTSAGESGRKTCVHANPSDTWEGLSRGSPAQGQPQRLRSALGAGVGPRTREDRELEI